MVIDPSPRAIAGLRAGQIQGGSCTCTRQRLLDGRASRHIPPNSYPSQSTSTVSSASRQESPILTSHRLFSVKARFGLNPVPTFSYNLGLISATDKTIPQNTRNQPPGSPPLRLAQPSTTCIN